MNAAPVTPSPIRLLAASPGVPPPRAPSRRRPRQPHPGSGSAGSGGLPALATPAAGSTALWRTGPWNTGPWNTGPWNSGPGNSGPGNSGPGNIGAGRRAAGEALGIEPSRPRWPQRDTGRRSWPWRCSWPSSPDRHASEPNESCTNKPKTRPSATDPLPTEGDQDANGTARGVRRASREDRTGMNYTPKQLQIMKFIRDYRREHTTSPTLEEIGQSLGVHRVTVHQHVAALVKKGAIRKLPQRSRSIEILDRDYMPRQTVPLLGRIAAGRPIEPVEEAEPFTFEELLPIQPGEDVFMLRVVGESMVEDHITDGDLVLVERADSARDGEIVVAIVNGEATLKRIYQEPTGGVRLQPANAAMQPMVIRPPDAWRSAAIVRGVLRRVLSPLSARSRPPVAAAAPHEDHRDRAPRRAAPDRPLQVGHAHGGAPRPPRGSRPPRRRPAARAAEPGRKRTTPGPGARRRRTSSRGPPRRGRAARAPPRASRRRGPRTTSMGTASETPSLRPVRERIAVIMPTTSPARRSGAGRRSSRRWRPRRSG